MRDDTAVTTNEAADAEELENTLVMPALDLSLDVAGLFIKDAEETPAAEEDDAEAVWALWDLCRRWERFFGHELERDDELLRKLRQGQGEH